MPPRSSVHRWTIVVAAALLGALSLVAASPARAEPGPADVLTSSADGTERLVESTADATAIDPGRSPDVLVHADRPRQRLAGVGAALTESSAHLIVGLPAAERRDLLASLFAADQGGLTVLRLVIGASDFSLDHVSFAEGPDLDSFSIDDDRDDVLPVLREILAINPDIELVASPWSAPAWMKDSGQYRYGQLRRDHEAAYAEYLVRYLEAYRAEGIDIGWLTVQNEPAAVTLDYPSMVMSPEQQARLVSEQLGPRLARAGLPTRVLAWDHNWCDAKPPGPCAGPAPASFPVDVLEAVDAGYPFGGTALHCYGGDQVVANEALHERWPGLRIWHTECSGGRWQESRAVAFDGAAALVVRDRNHWSNATLLWNLALDPDGGPHLGGCGTCRGVVTVDPEADRWWPEVDYDVLAQAARFVPAGSGVLERTVAAPDDLEVTAACSPSARPSAMVRNRGPATEVLVRFDGTDAAVDVVVRAPADSLVSVAAPAGVGCVRAAEAPLAPPPSVPPTVPPTVTTTAPSPTEPVAPAASPVAGAPSYTG
jgi:glucosylceramidase